MFLLLKRINRKHQRLYNEAIHLNKDEFFFVGGLLLNGIYDMDEKPHRHSPQCEIIKEHKQKSKSKKKKKRKKITRFVVII